MFLCAQIVTFVFASYGLVYAAEMPVNIKDMQPGVIYTSKPATTQMEKAETNLTESPATTQGIESFAPCQCYCSDLCGMRARKADDQPFVDPETGICFCKQRDKNNYIPNGCNTKPKAELKPELGPECCGR